MAAFVALRVCKRAADVVCALDRRACRPSREVGVSLPGKSLRVEEDTRARPDQKLVDLTAYVAKIDAGAVHVCHVGRQPASKVDMNVRRPRNPLRKVA